MSLTVKLIAIGVIILSLGLCMVFGSVGLYIALAERSRAAVWEPVVTEKDRLRQQMQDDLQMLQTRHKGNIPPKERMAFIRRTTELDQRIEQMMFTNPQLRGKVPKAIGQKLGQPLMTEAMLALAASPQPESPQDEARRIARAEQRRQTDEMIERINRSGEREAERQAVAREAMVMQKAEADRIWSEIEAYYTVPGEPGTRRQLLVKQEALIIKMRQIENGLRTTYHPGDRFAMVLEDYRKLQQQMIDLEVEEEARKRSAAVADAQLKQFELESAERRRKLEEERVASGLLPRTGAYTIGPDGKLIPLVSSGPSRPNNPPPTETPQSDPFSRPAVATNAPFAANDSENPLPPSETPAVDPLSGVESQLGEPQSGETQPGEAPQPPPTPLSGFAVDELAELQAGSKILVRVQDKWLPATITAKRSKLFDIRYDTGDIAVVKPDRIRWQADPMRK